MPGIGLLKWAHISVKWLMWKEISCFVHLNAFHAFQLEIRAFHWNQLLSLICKSLLLTTLFQYLSSFLQNDGNQTSTHFRQEDQQATFSLRAPWPSDHKCTLQAYIAWSPSLLAARQLVKTILIISTCLQETRFSYTLTSV